MTPAAKGIGREQNASQGGANPDMVLAALPDEPVPPPPPPPPLEVLDAEMFALANVNVRAGPITQTEKLTTIAIGAPVAVVGKTGDWFQVALANGGVGYILGRYLGDAAQPQPPATETGTQSWRCVPRVRRAGGGPLRFSTIWWRTSNHHGVK